MINDTLSDMLVRIKNAQAMKKPMVTVVGSKLNANVCKVLTHEGFIENFELQSQDKKSSIVIKLKYYHAKPVIQTLKRISKPSLRVYVKANEIPNIVDGFGAIIISTPKGIMSHIEAKKANLGGEQLFLVN